MFKAGIGLIALAGITLVTPALAQSLHIEGSGVSVGVGERHHGRSHDYDRRRHHGIVVRDHDSYAYARCKTTRIIRSDGSVKTIRRCR